jgi:hypothetical protein
MMNSTFGLLGATASMLERVPTSPKASMLESCCGSGECWGKKGIGAMSTYGLRLLAIAMVLCGASCNADVGVGTTSSVHVLSWNVHWQCGRHVVFDAASVPGTRVYRLKTQ